MPHQRCPRCNSPQPHLHPAVQHGGEVQPCHHEFHSGNFPVAEEPREPGPLSLAELKVQRCTLSDLQDVVIKLIELHNEQGAAMQAAINKKQDRQWRATI